VAQFEIVALSEPLSELETCTLRITSATESGLSGRVSTPQDF
jgi:hypothetical protein